MANTSENGYYYEKYKLQGLCVKCGKPAIDGATECEECQAKHRERQRIYYHSRSKEVRDKQCASLKAKRDKARKKGICTNCLKNRADKGYSTCWRCRADKNDAQRGRYDTETEEHRSERIAKATQKSKERKQRLLDQGLCISCGKRKADYGKQKCRYCTEKHNAARREKAHASGVLPSYMRGDGRYCKMCCKPLCNGEKLCSECMKKQQAIAGVMNKHNAEQAHNSGYLLFRGLENTRKQEVKINAK